MEDKEILKAFKLAIDAILDRLDEMDTMYHQMNEASDERLHKLESCLYEEILDPVNSLYEERQRKQRREDFGAKYKEDLDPFCEDYKKLYGDELDLYDDCFAEYDKLSDDDKEAYLDKVKETIKKDSERMKDKFGTKPEEKGTGMVEELIVVEPLDENEKNLNEWEEAAEKEKKYRK